MYFVPHTTRQQLQVKHFVFLHCTMDRMAFIFNDWVAKLYLRCTLLLKGHTH